MDRRQQLEAWMNETRRLQRRMAGVFGALAALALVLVAWRPGVGGFALVFVVLTAVIAFWVTASHNAAHRQKLAELDALARTGGQTSPAAHRRWG